MANDGQKTVQSPAEVVKVTQIWLNSRYSHIKELRKMKRTFAGLFLLTAVCIFTSAAQTGFGESSLFNDGWTFVLRDVEGGEDPGTDDSAWERVELPHDWSVKGVLSPANASCTGFLPAGSGWYRKHFRVGDDAPEKLYIYFEGVYCRSSVYLNGHLLGHRPSGYASFMYDMSPWLRRDGDNVLAVRVDHSRIADSRWYPGSGIYRNVWLISSGRTHFSQWGVTYRTLSVRDGLAAVEVDVSAEGLENVAAKLSVRIKDTDGKTLASKTVRAAERQTLTLELKNPVLWDLESCRLYTIEASLASGGAVLDRCEVKAGFRTLGFSPDTGFSLNGKNMKIKGVCLHHDAGVLGAAVPEEVLERRLLQLKELGANAIRTSHNPQSPVFYELCDRMGFLVMDEAFDEWEFNKKKWVEGWNVGVPAMDGTADFFEEWAERDVTDMVMRDRNHPCIFLWSIGNEVDYPNDPYSHPVLDGDNSDFTQPAYGGYRKEQPDAMRIGGIARRLASCVRKADRSRPVTGALAGVAMSNQTGYPEAVDVVGYNYTESRYAKDHALYPERIIYGSENGSGYGSWKAVRDNDFIFGQFIWTGADYLGESNEWPSRGFYSGMLDLANNIKPRGRFRQALWREDPVCYIGSYPAGRGEDSFDAWDSWDYAEGDTVRVVCYTNAATVKLMLNGKQQGQVLGRDDSDGIVGWDVPYAPGRLEALAYDEEGRQTASYAINSCSRPYALKASLLNSPSEGGVAIILVEILDEMGNAVKLADNEITCRTSGCSLMGLESGCNTDMTDWTDNVHRAYRGRIVAYVRLGSEAGSAEVEFTSPYLVSCSLTAG